MTTTRSAWLSAAALAFLTFSPAAARAAQEAKLPLQVELGLKATTTTRLVGGAKMMAFSTATGTVDLGFGDLTVTIVAAGRGHELEIDVAGDKHITRAERIPITNGAATLTYTRPGDTAKTAYRVTFTRVEVAADRKGINGISAQIHPDFAWRATLGKAVIRLIDANLDGKLTQDGHDAIAIGASDLALPLLKRHYIDGKEYDLTLAADGSSLTAAALGDAEHGRVTLPYRTAALKHLVLRSDSQAYDVLVNPMIPPDTYTVAIGLLSQGSDTVAIAPGISPAAYVIKGGFANQLRIGPPLSVTFSGLSDAGKLTVHPPSAILGLGGERYFIQYPSSSRATVSLLSAGRTVSSGPFPCDKFGQPYAYSAHHTGLADAWQVEVRIPIPGLSARLRHQGRLRQPAPHRPAVGPPPPAPATVLYQPLADKPTTRP
ncbi:MAG: hypothetical protein NT031_17005 [Planctomycetota bacterium]|nr:hypothetical protein [Planctomycetota bacterium]